MTPTYDEAVATLTEALRASDDFGAPEVYCTRETARALLAGPPEPSEEDVARTLCPEAFLWGGAIRQSRLRPQL